LSGLSLLEQLRTQNRPTNRQKARACIRLAEAAGNKDHPDFGLEFDALLADEMSRKPLPNRRTLRAHGIRSGYTRRRYVLGQQARQMELLDAIEDDPTRLARHKIKRAEALSRRERVAARIADRKVRLGL
jgi:hypothetical protein